MWKFATLLLVTTLISLVWGGQLPPDFDICKRSDKNVDNCLQSAIQAALPKMANGFKGVNERPLQPLTVASATIEGGKGVVNAQQSYKNFKIYDIIRTKIDSIKTEILANGLKLDVKAHSPEYRFEADYELSGRILLLPISGKGKCIVTLKEVDVELHLSGELYEKKGKQYLRATEITIVFKPGKVEYNFENLLGGGEMNNESLGAEMNKVLNENWKEVFEDVQASYEEVVAVAIQDYINGVFSNSPYDEIFPN